MSANGMNKLFNIWEATLAPFDTPPPFTSSDDMYETIDSTPYGNLCWESFTVQYNLNKDPPSNKAPAAWKTAECDGWFRDPWKLIRNIIANRSFDNEFDYAAYQEYDYKGQHQFHDLFSGNWCWRQSVSAALNKNLISMLISFCCTGYYRRRPKYAWCHDHPCYFGKRQNNGLSRYR